MCYSQQIAVRVTSRVPPPLTWHISQKIIDVLSSVVSVSVLNQSLGHWLLSNALNVTITMSPKLFLKIEISLNL